MTHELPGIEHFNEFNESFPSKQKQIWPEAEDQIHCREWKRAKGLLPYLRKDKKIRILHLCCGEGSTCISLAQQLDCTVVGIDMVTDHISTATESARMHKLSERVSFVHGNIFHLPFDHSSFDYVIGQDPDGIGHHKRELIFKEVFRILKPSGGFMFDHWARYLFTAPGVKKQFDSVSSSGGFKSFKNLNTDAYLSALLISGFTSFFYVDQSSQYKRHMQPIKAKSVSDVDPWTELWLSASRTNTLGFMMFATKINT